MNMKEQRFDFSESAQPFDGLVGGLIDDLTGSGYTDCVVGGEGAASSIMEMNYDTLQNGAEPLKVLNEIRIKEKNEAITGQGKKNVSIMEMHPDTLTPGHDQMEDFHLSGI